MQPRIRPLNNTILCITSFGIEDHPLLLHHTCPYQSPEAWKFLQAVSSASFKKSRNIKMLCLSLTLTLNCTMTHFIIVSILATIRIYCYRKQCILKMCSLCYCVNYFSRHLRIQRSWKLVLQVQKSTLVGFSYFDPLCLLSSKEILVVIKIKMDGSVKCLHELDFEF